MRDEEFHHFLARVDIGAQLAADDAVRASRAADSVFTRFGGKALPGLLVVLGTALVAAVGAGNLRPWQGLIAAKRAKTSA